MTGRPVRTATLHSASGRPVHLTVIRPDRELRNVAELSKTYVRWHAEAVGLEATQPSAAFHAQFAAEVAWVAASELRWFTERPDRILVVAVDDAGEVLGINTAYWVEVEQVWYLAVGTTRPQDQPGYPNPDQVRGIGSQLIGAMLDEMNAIVCAPVTLEPLDEDARRFWAARGFHAAGPDEMRMSCPESQELARRLAAAPPDCPDRGDCTAVTDQRVKARMAR